MKTSIFVYASALVVLCATPAVFAQAASPSYSQGYVTPQAGGGAPIVTPASMGGGSQKPDGKCDGGCGGKCVDCCLTGGWWHRMSFYGEFLYLRARDAEVAYAVPFDGPITAGLNTIQVGPVGVADMDFQPGFRAGFDFILSECDKIGAQYTMWEGGTTDQVITQAPNVLRSLVSHPGTSTAAQDHLQAQAQYDINFDLVDVNYQRLLQYCDDYQLGTVFGVRLMQQEQTFEADFAGSGTEHVETDIDFYGAGLRAGLEYERYVGCQWTLFAKGYGNLVPGEFRADYRQGQSFDSRVVDTSWKAGRILSIWELETGIGWTSKCGWYSLMAGYHYSAWTNMVQTDEWIRGVHQNSFIDMDSTSTFDGLIARFEARY